MAGQMGNERVTTQNLEVVAIDEEHNLILVKGAVPGAKSGWVLITDAIKKPFPKDAPLPAGIIERAEATPAKDEKPAEEAPQTDEAAKAEAPAENKTDEEKKGE
jgi:large subunit ribosomal protein L3